MLANKHAAHRGWRHTGVRIVLGAFVLLIVSAFTVPAAVLAAGSNTISTVAGGGRLTVKCTPDWVCTQDIGDGGPATSALLVTPSGVAMMPDGGYVVSSWNWSNVRRVSPTGTITTLAGGMGANGFSGDGGPATQAQLNAPYGVAVQPDGSVLIADSNNFRIRKVSPTGTITTVAGNGTEGFAGDGGPATAAKLDLPVAVAATRDGGFLIADAVNNRIRKVSASGIITTVAGNGAEGFSGDGGPATAARLWSPNGVSVTSDGGFLIVDDNNNRVRRVSPTGTITTVAGNGIAGFSGDGGPARGASLSLGGGAVETPDGGLLIADTGNQRVRRVSPTGTITTVAGTGDWGFLGDGGPATLAQIKGPWAVAATATGGFLIADTNNNRVRLVDAAFR
jgi:NHL repeat-containing protein